VAALVAVLAVVAAGAAVLVGGGPGDADEDTSEAQPPRPQVAFAQAVQRFGRAGSFAFRGTLHVAGPSRLRPGEWLADEATIEGAVRLPQSITREVAVGGEGRAAETVTSGPRVWGRAAPSAGELVGAAWAVVGPFDASLRDGSERSESWPSRLGMALVVDLLRWAGEAREQAPDAGGRRVLAATVPEDRNGERRYGDVLAGGTVTVTLDDAGDIVHVVVASTEPDPELVLDVDIERLGEADVVSPADVGEPARQVVAGELDALDFEPVELGRLPPGWALTDASVSEGAPSWPDETNGCAWLGLDYRDLRAVSGGQLHLSVTSEACAGETSRGGEGSCVAGCPPPAEPLRAGAFSGTIDEHEYGGQILGRVSDGMTAVDFSTDLPADEVARLLESLGPLA
jgi:hypothetical protein